MTAPPNGPSAALDAITAAGAAGEPMRADGTPYTGTGPAPAAVRVRCLTSFWDRISLLERIADGDERQEVVTKDGVDTVGPSLKDRMTALGMLGKYAGLEKIVLEGGLSDDAAELLQMAREARERAQAPYRPPAPTLPPGGP